MKRWHHTVAALVVIGAYWLGVPPAVSTQSRVPVWNDPSTWNLAAPAARGEAWFYQRCSLCHMGRIVKDETYEPMAPSLNGLLKNAPPDREKLVREQILRGSLRMPGFRYNLTPAEFEELMTYLKTLSD
jgi:mono/diheme cytochrome c family protein